MTTDLLTLHVREALSLPPEWHAYAWACLPRPQNGQKDWKATHFQVNGAVAPLITKGKNKGCHNWAKLDKSTLREFVTSIADHERWKSEWEIRTGKCHRCHGTGKTIARVTATEKTYRQCTRCKGTGSPPLTAPHSHAPAPEHSPHNS